MGLLDYGGVICRVSQPGGRGYLDLPALAAGGSEARTADSSVSPSAGFPAALEESPLIARAFMHDARSLPVVSRLAARAVRCALPPLQALPPLNPMANQQMDEEVLRGGANYTSPVMWASLRVSLDGGESCWRWHS